MHLSRAAVSSYLKRGLKLVYDTFQCPMIYGTGPRVQVPESPGPRVQVPESQGSITNV